VHADEIDYSSHRMRHRVARWVPGLVAVALSALGFAGCGTEEDPNLDHFELSGLVHDDLDGHAVRGVTVTFRSDTLRMADATTDGDGHYEMVVETDVKFGQVRAERAGYEPAEASVFFDTDRRRIDLRLRPAAMME